MKNLYTTEYRKIMEANLDHTSMSSNRIEDIKNFAQGIHFERIGIAHCITFSREAEILKTYFSKYFEVYTVGCKHGKMTKGSLVGGTSGRVLCNPAGQADFLNKKGTQLNISMGLCVGHDMIFSKVSDGLVTNLFDKDFTNNNNPEQAMAEIYSQIDRL